LNVEWRDAPATLPAGERLYAIGDIHGCLGKLTALHSFIAADLAARPARARLVHLGDVIDRGPDSAGCIEAVLGFAACPVTTLMGNHEDTANDALAGASHACTDWLHTGGAAALRSWGVDPDGPRSGWTAGIPAAHLQFMAGLPLYLEAGPYLFVHAGIRPGLPPVSQLHDDLLRIRRSFLDSEADHGRIVGPWPHADARPPARAAAEPHQSRHRRLLRGRAPDLCGARGRARRLRAGLSRPRCLAAPHSVATIRWGVSLPQGPDRRPPRREELWCRKGAPRCPRAAPAA
jgi:serine/threonine protein phosphatase 1